MGVDLHMSDQKNYRSTKWTFDRSIKVNCKNKLKEWFNVSIGVQYNDASRMFYPI